jgi:hypothetical protein
MEERSRIVLLAATIRLAIAPFFMHAGDVGTIYESSIMVLKGANIFDFVYAKTMQMQTTTGLPVFFEGYAYHPLLIYFFAPFYWLFTLIAGQGPVMIDGHYPSVPVLIYPWTPLLLLMLKIPIILADVLVVYILAGMDSKKAKIYAFCPYVIFISVVWGMFDALVALFLLLSYLTSSRNSFLSGLFYGLSLMKLYTIVLLPLYVVRLFGKWKEFGTFLAGFAVTLLPIVYYLIVSPVSIWNVLVTFQGGRLMGGVNLYNFIWVVQDLRFDLAASMIPNIFLVVALLCLIVKFGRKAPLLESTLAIMFAYFLFGKVINEQFLVSIFPLMLLCKECDHRLWIAPFVFVFLRSPFYYFMLPILWTSPIFYGYYLQADEVWRQLQAAGYLQIPMYAVGVAFSLLIFWNLLRVIDTARGGIGSTYGIGDNRAYSKTLGVQASISRLATMTGLSRARCAFSACSPRRSMPSQR